MAQMYLLLGLELEEVSTEEAICLSQMKMSTPLLPEVA